MSKLYEKYLSLKKENDSILYLFKSGIFYIFLDEDAKKISNILNLKLSNLNENVLKCGFPVNSLQKYLNLLKNMNYDVQIIENNYNNADKNNITDVSLLENFLLKIANINPYNLSIKEVYLFLENISKEANLIIKNRR